MISTNVDTVTSSKHQNKVSILHTRNN